MQQSFFVSSFTINSTSLDEYQPVIVNNPDTIAFHGILTSYIKNIYRGDDPVNFDEAIDLIVQLNLITPEDPVNISHDPTKVDMLRITMDQKRAVIGDMPSFSDPAQFDVSLSAFKNDNITKEMLPKNNYYLEVNVLVQSHGSDKSTSIFTTTFPAIVNLERNGD
ncbi:hypothetical protein IWT25_00704 [Secundilactobacillus pentosiphilus]|uniref:Uncharacterized protein n=1 Tax=Secundilactobacillus pentosiphilus TaxID=1714682 RepID=A0A1Z5IUG0_9LACO|nr:hypothetical protein [Secundilactobacillus pentosiphilus]GAX05400.1 hypothetical protein IWT25_00704 [Secundilactobacillus pentosiphilus]